MTRFAAVMAHRRRQPSEALTARFTGTHLVHGRAVRIAHQHATHAGTPEREGERDCRANFHDRPAAETHWPVF